MVRVKINRKGEEKVVQATLNNRKGNTYFVQKVGNDLAEVLGADFETLGEKTAKQLEIEGGVKVKNLHAGKLSKQTGMWEGFIITKVDGQKVKTVEGLLQVLKRKIGGQLIKGVCEDIPGEYYYALGL